MIVFGKQHHDLFLAVFITSTADSKFSAHTNSCVPISLSAYALSRTPGP